MGSPHSRNRGTVEHGSLGVGTKDGGAAEAPRARILAPAMSDFAMGAINAALDGLAARQRITAQNIANADTPGYIAGRVNFEDSLRSASESNDFSKFSVTANSSDDPVNLNGNNVAVDEENVSMVDTGLRFQLMTEAMNNKFHILKTSIG